MYFQIFYLLTHYQMKNIAYYLLLKTNKTLNDMAKVQIKSKKLAPFGGFFRLWSSLILFQLKLQIPPFPPWNRDAHCLVINIVRFYYHLASARYEWLLSPKHKGLSGGVRVITFQIYCSAYAHTQECFFQKKVSKSHFYM